MNTTRKRQISYEHGYLKQVMEQVANQVKAVLEERAAFRRR
ncbi:MAG: hypothetical protein ACLR3S_05145 [Clostridium fessum]